MIGLGVLCSDQDGAQYNKTLKELRPIIRELDHHSIIGEVWIHSMLGCIGWPIRSKDIYKGPFGGRTATPIVSLSGLEAIHSSAFRNPSWEGVGWEEPI